MKSQRNMLGLERLLGEGGEVVKETDLFRCNHCQAMVDVQPFKSPSESGGYCTGCDNVICNRCVRLMARTGICEPFEIALDRYERETETLRRWGVNPNQYRASGLLIPS